MGGFSFLDRFFLVIKLKKTTPKLCNITNFENVAQKYLFNVVTEK